MIYDELVAWRKVLTTNCNIEVVVSSYIINKKI